MKLAEFSCVCSADSFVGRSWDPVKFAILVIFFFQPEFKEWKKQCSSVGFSYNCWQYFKVLALIARSFPCEWRRYSLRLFNFLDSFTFTHLYLLSEMEVSTATFRLFRSAWNIHIQPRYKIKWSLKLQRKRRKQKQIHNFHRDRVVLLNQLPSITEFATLISIESFMAKKSCKEISLPTTPFTY